MHPPLERFVHQKVKEMRAQESHPAWQFLLIGGDAGLYKTLTAAITAIGGEVTTASTAQAARSVVARRKLDGMFVDMHVRGALELLYNIRQRGSNRNSIVIAYADPADQGNPVLRHLANFVLGKPLAAFQVKDILEAALPLIAAERERYLRYQVSLPVVLQIQEQSQRAITANISQGGMAVRCNSALAPGASVGFELELPMQQTVRGHGEVAWSKENGEIGIEFQLAGEEARKSLWKLISQSKSDF